MHIFSSSPSTFSFLLLPSKITHKSCHMPFLTSSTCFPSALLSLTATSDEKSSFSSVRDKIHPTQRNWCQDQTSVFQRISPQMTSPLLLWTYSFHNTFQQWPQPDSFATANLYQHLMYFICFQCCFWVCNRLWIPWSMSRYILYSSNHSVFNK